MILSVCPNPSIDCTMELDQLFVGRLNRVENKIITYSGKALNSAIGVSRLGAESFATGFMFEDEGNLFVQSLEKEGIKSNFIWNKGNVRVNYKIVDNKSMLTEINDRGLEVTPKKQQELIDFVKEKSKDASIVIMSGSLPKGVSDDYYAKLIKSVPKNVKCVVDTEGEKLINAVKQGVYMVKPNLRELENIVERPLKTNKDYIEGAKILIDMGAENVMLSLGGKGAILYDGKKSYYCKSTSVAVNSTVGAGDSMVAAACVMIEKNADKKEILKCAVSAGTASITTPGTNLFYKDKFDEIYEKLSVEEM